MRFAVESWAPEYGSPADEPRLADSVADVDASVERGLDDWAPIDPSPTVDPAADLLFVDGVRRIEAHVWITDSEGRSRQGFCASYAAGAVRCDQRARVVAAEVRRGLFTSAGGADRISATCGGMPLDFEVQAAPSDDPEELSLVLQGRMGGLENEVATAASGGELTIVDGPLKAGQDDQRFVGYVKTHRRAYGPDVVREVATTLGIGQRTPLMVIGQRPRYSWYLRLPCPIDHGWDGVVRLEVPASASSRDAARLADRLARSLPRFASVPQKDPRAPQNLYPIAGLERELRRRLGDPALLFRALRSAASTSA